MPTINTLNGVAFRTSNGSLAVGDCDCLSGAITTKCGCGSACTARFTSYRVKCCDQNGTGYNHATWNTSGTLGVASCCSDCCKTVGGYVNEQGATYNCMFNVSHDINGVSPGSGSSSISALDMTFLPSSNSMCDETRTVYPVRFTNPTACETKLRDVFHHCDDEFPGRVLSCRVVDYLGFRGTGSYLAVNMPLPSNYPFFRTLSPGESWIQFFQTTNCNAGLNPTPTAHGGSHTFTLEVAAAVGMKMTARVERADPTQDQVVVVQNGGTDTVTFSGGFYAANNSFVLRFIVEAL